MEKWLRHHQDSRFQLQISTTTIISNKRIKIHLELKVPNNKYYEFAQQTSVHSAGLKSSHFLGSLQGLLSESW